MRARLSSSATLPRRHPCTSITRGHQPRARWVPLAHPPHPDRTTHQDPYIRAWTREGRFYAGVLGELYGSHRPHTPHHCTIARCAVLMSHMSSCAISVHVLRYLQARHELYVAPDR